MEQGFTISAQTIITLAALIAAIIAIMKNYNRAYDLIKHQKEQDEEIASVKKGMQEDINAIMKEQTLMTYGVLACLKGLKEQGCDGPVTEAIDKIDKYLNKAAHGQLD